MKKWGAFPSGGAFTLFMTFSEAFPSEVQEMTPREIHVSIPPAERRIVQDGSAKDCTYILPVTDGLEQVLRVRPTLELPQGQFKRKKEFHATAIGFGKREEVRLAIERLNMEGKDGIRIVNDLLSSIDFSFDIIPADTKLIVNRKYDPPGVRAGTSFESEASVVVHVRMPGMEEFYSRLREEAGVDLGVPVSHVTLYIKENGDATGLGIGLYDLAAQTSGEDPQLEVTDFDIKTLSDKEVVGVGPENCYARVGKGGSAEGIPRDMLVVDTGQPTFPPPEMRSPRTPEEVDELYRWTIRNGIVDHHSIDASVLSMPEGATRRCAAKMVADFPSEVAALIKDHDIRSVSGHTDSDLDSITATYLTKTLVDSRDSQSLPAFTERLGNFVNLVDYGRFSETNPDKVVQSLMGYFGALKSQTLGRMGAEMGAVWRSDAPLADKQARAQAVSDKFHKEIMRHMFVVYNACAASEVAGTTIDFANLDAAGLALPADTRALLEAGKKEVRADLEAFNKEFEAAEKTKVVIRTKEGEDLEVPLVVFGHTQLSPLLVMNMSYSRMPPETIVAAYAGQERTKGGDCYDVGIKPETLDLFDITFLEIPLNEAEAKKRAGVPEDQYLEAWVTLRRGKEYLRHGDPTVAVAGGSLIAASNTSLLSPEEFHAALMNAFQR